MFYSLAMFDAPMQWILVMVIALVVFGPKRLPELGKQIGSALKELNKAKNDMMRNLNMDDEPEPYRYPETKDYSDYNYNAPAAVEPGLDLTDYTLVSAVTATSEQAAEDYVPALPGYTPDIIEKAEDSTVAATGQQSAVEVAKVHIEGEQHVL